MLVKPFSPVTFLSIVVKSLPSRASPLSGHVTEFARVSDKIEIRSSIPRWAHRLMEHTNTGVRSRTELGSSALIS